VSRHYNGPAEALLAVVEHDVLAGRRTGQRHGEADVERVGIGGHGARDVRLPITNFGGTGKLRCRRAPRNPVGIRRAQAAAVQ
jgi:hypothetical protein